MKRVLPLITSVFALLLGATSALSQQGARINYRSTVFVRVAPEKEAAMVDFVKTASRKVIEERMNSGEPITSWVVLRLAYQGSPSLDYNYVVSTTYAGAPSQPNEATRDQVYRKATGMSYQDYMAKLPTLGTNVGSVLYRDEATAPGSPISEGNAITVTRWKITPLRGADYGRFVQTMLLPLNSQAVQEGRIAGWIASRVVSPGGEEAPFDAVISIVGKDMSAALPTTLPSPDQGQIQFAKVFPGQNYSAFIDQGRSLRALARTEMFRVVTAVGGTTTTSSSSGGGRR